MYAYCTTRYLPLEYENRKRKKYTLVAIATKNYWFLYKCKKKNHGYNFYFEENFENLLV